MSSLLGKIKKEKSSQNSKITYSKNILDTANYSKERYI